MKTLYLLRHAQAQSDDPASDDHDRPLDAVGEHAATAMGAHFAERAYRPSIVLCSSARRAQQTLERLLPHLPGHPELLIEAELYLASAGRLLARLREIDDGQSELLLIGHNPGIADLARGLAGRGERSSLRRLAARFPMAAAAACEFELERWRELAPGGGRLLAYATPQDLI